MKKNKKMLAVEETPVVSDISAEGLAEATGQSEAELFSFVEYHPEEAERIGYSEYSYWKSVWRNFLKKKSAVIMLVIFLAVFIFSFLAISPLFTEYKHYSELTTNRNMKFALPGTVAEVKDKKTGEVRSHKYLFGADNIGRDYWYQVWYATQHSVLLAAIVGVGEVIVGVIMGLLWGYVRKLDRIFTEIYNIIYSVPTIIYMTLIALMIGKTFMIMCISLIIFNWIYTAKNIRNLVFMYRDREYNLASRCLGTKLGTILLKNILPYMISVIILRMALAIPQTIGMETTLAYLGLLDVQEPALGLLLRNSREQFANYPHILIFPAVIVSLITVTFYLAGNAFSDAADPRNHV